MRKYYSILQLIVIFVAPILLGLTFGPTYISNDNFIFGFQSVYLKPILAISFLLPFIGSLLVLLSPKIKDIELVSIALFLLGGILILTSQEKEGILAFCSIILVILAFLSVILLFISLNKKNMYSTYDIVEGAMLIAIAIALDLPGLKIRLGSGGGSISFTCVPLLILALRQGPIKGFIGAGIVYGLITCLLDGWGLFTYPFDYLLGYGSLCIVGFFKPLIFANEKITFKGILFLSLGIVISIFVRLCAGTLSSIVLYEYKFVAALTYNIIYILPSGGISLALILLLYKPLLMIDRHFTNHRFGE